jgi:raw
MNIDELTFASHTGIINQYNKQCSQTDENTIIGICNQQRQQQHNNAFNRSYAIDASSSTSSMASNDERQPLVMSSNGPKSDSSRDSGTSSPLPNEIIGKSLNGNSGSSIHSKSSLSGKPEIIKTIDYDSDSNDSNDSVFSNVSSMDDEQNLRDMKDIYLGGSCALRTKWRQEIAIPMLNKKNVTFHLPTLDENLSVKKVHKEGKSFIQEVAEIRDESSLMFKPRILDYSSRVLLFVITNETRSLAPMTLAAHYIGMNFKVVLCIQTLKENCKIGNDVVSI